MVLKLYLASNSPRRRELLQLAQWDYNHLPVQVDETPLPNEDSTVYVRRISASKARNAVDQVGENSIIIAADTAVVDRGIDGRKVILGKPVSPSHAVDMLHSLRGHTHQVVTAITILRKDDGQMLNDACLTDVPMRDYGDDEIDEYVRSGDALDKAGAYAIQHAGFHPVEGLHGCYANVMGLPLCHLTRSLSRYGVCPQVDIPQACQAALQYDCPAYQDILSEKNWEAAPV